MCSKKLNVLFVTTSFPTKANPSSGIFVKKLADQLDKNGIEIRIITPDDQSHNNSKNVTYFSYAPKEKQTLCHQDGGIPSSFKLAPFKSTWLSVKLVFYFLYNIKKYSSNATVIHAHWALPGLLSGIVNIFSRKPVITTLRGEDANKAINGGPFKTIVLATAALNKKIICVSTPIEENIKKLAPKYKNKIIHIPNGVSEEFFADSKKLENKQITVTTVGSLIERKCIDTLLMAMKLLPENIEWKLNIIGDGPLKQNLKDLSKKLAIDSKTSFQGKLPQSEISKILQATDIFVITSSNEGKPNALIEAMAAECICIASDIEAHRAIINPDINGLIFQLKNHHNLFDNLYCISKDITKHRQLGINARKTLENENISWETCAKEHEILYKELLQINEK